MMLSQNQSAASPFRCLPLLLLSCLLHVANSSMAVAGAGTTLAGKQPSAASAVAAAAPDTATVPPTAPPANATAATALGPKPPAEAHSGLSGSQGHTEAPSRAVQPSAPEGSGGWEASFAWGLYYSNLAVDTAESASLRWALDRVGSDAAVPQTMLRAEEWLLAGVSEATPEKKQREKKAEQALRIYYHAKWLPGRE
mmetsp:Transcript_1446/g.3306  ORF Transcript_1446/g.3306 Transcript_1446/m.3306 type:complete len:197 (-) Transcript_1446:11-601(-)